MPAAEPLSFGQHHHTIRTSSADAQKMFNQGLAQAFGFNHEAAIRSFERAAELDPTAAMPHWGKAWALGPNCNLDIDEARAKAAHESVAKAQSLVTGGFEHEKAYIGAKQAADRTSEQLNPHAAMMPMVESMAVMHHFARGTALDIAALSLAARIAAARGEHDRAITFWQRELDDAWKNADTTLTLEMF